LAHANSDPSSKSPIYRYLGNASVQGQGRLTFWGFNVYDARYYVADPRGQNGFALEIHYSRSFKGGDAFAKAFFGIWLDERTSVPKLRSALIASRCPPALIAANCPNP